MALECILIFDPDGDNKRWYLKADRISYNLERIVTHTPLPGDEDPISLDLGMKVPRYDISGLVDTSTTAGGYPKAVSKEELEDDTNSYWGDNVVRLTIPGRTYQGKIKSLSMALDGGQEDRWAFNLSFLVESTYSS